MIILPDDIEAPNTPPIFLQDPPPQIVATAGDSEFTFAWTLPQIFDAEGDNVRVDFDFAALTGWLVFDEA